MSYLGFMEEYAGLFRSIRPSVRRTAWRDGGGRQDTTTVSTSFFLGSLLSGGCDGLLVGIPSLVAFLVELVGLLSLPLCFLLSTDSLLRLELVRMPFPRSSPTVSLPCVLSSVLCICGVVMTVSWGLAVQSEALMMLLLVLFPRSSPTVSLLLSSVECICGVVITVSWGLVVLSEAPGCPWVKDAVPGMSFRSLRSFSSSWSPSVGEETLPLPPPDLHLVALMLLGRRGELWGVGDSGGIGVRV